MKRLLVILCVALLGMPVAMGAPSDDGPIEVDWYPLFTDSVGWNIYSGGFLFGWVNAPTGLDVDMGRSYELAWLNVAGAKFNTGHGQRITMGVGIDWRNYKLHRGTRFLWDDDHIAVGDYPATAAPRSSRLKVFSLTVPIIFRQRLVNKVDLMAGAIVNFNVHGSLETVYDLDGEKITERTTRIHQVPVTIDLMAGVKWSCLGAYVRYSPCHVLQQDHAPAFTTFSTGIFLGF